MMINTHSPFIFVANNLAIDFVNTCVQKNGAPFELLNSEMDFLSWAHQAGFSLSVEVPEVDLQRSYQFRQALKTLFTAKADHQPLPSKALELLNSYLKNAPIQQQLVQTSHQLSLQPLNSVLSFDQLLGDIAYRASQVLVSSAKQPIRKCASDQCILLFLDISKAKKRRWCSMEICGNRAKAATFYQTGKAQQENTQQ